MKKEPESLAAQSGTQSGAQSVSKGRVSRKVEVFLRESYPKRSYMTILQRFLRKKREKGLSEHTIARLYYNLHAVGKSLGNPPLADIAPSALRSCLDDLWLRYAPDTMRTITGDVRGFFRWCKTKDYHSKNVAERLKPIRHNSRRRRRARAAPEGDVQEVMAFLAGRLKAEELVYRDLFRQLQPVEEGWSDESVHVLRDLFILTFLYETGARAGELSRLGAQSMDEVTHLRAPVYLITVNGKTNDRDRYFTEKTAELWRIWQQVRGGEGEALAIVGWRGGRAAGQLLANGISQMLARRCREAGVRPFRAQSLRHAKVKRSRQQVGLEMASVLIDHSTLRTTWGYANVDDDEITAAAAATGLQTDLWT